MDSVSVPSSTARIWKSISVTTRNQIVSSSRKNDSVFSYGILSNQQKPMAAAKHPHICHRVSHPFKPLGELRQPQPRCLYLELHQKTRIEITSWMRKNIQTLSTTGTFFIDWTRFTGCFLAPGNCVEIFYHDPLRTPAKLAWDGQHAFLMEVSNSWGYPNSCMVYTRKSWKIHQ